MASGNVGKLSLILSVNAGGLISGFRNATTVVKGFNKDVNSSMASAAKAFAKPTAALKGFSSAMVGPLKVVAGVAAGVTGAAGALAYFAKTQGDVLDASNKSAKAMGISTESYLALSHAADLSGLSQDELYQSMTRLSRTIAKALSGETKSIEALAQIGYTAKELASIPLDQALGKVADRMVAIPNATMRAAAAFGVFGKSGLVALPMLMDGSAGLKAAAEDAKTFGWAINQIDAGIVEAMNDNFTRVAWAVRGIGAQLAVRVAPYVVAITDQLMEWLRSVGGVPALFDRMQAGLRNLVLMGGEFYNRMKLGAIEARIAFEQFVYETRVNLTNLANTLVKFNNAVPWSEKMTPMASPDAKAHASKLTGLAYGASKAAVAPNPAEPLLAKFDAWAAGIKKNVSPKMKVNRYDLDMLDDFENVDDKTKALDKIGDKVKDTSDKFSSMGDEAKAAARAISGSFGQGSAATVAFGVGGIRGRGSRGGGGVGGSAPFLGSYQARNMTGSKYQLARGIGAPMGGQVGTQRTMSQAERNYRGAAAYVPGFVDLWDNPAIGGGKGGGGEATGLLRQAVGHLAQLNQAQRNPSRRQAAYAG